MTGKRERLDDGAELVWRYEWDDWDMLSAVETPRGLRAEYDYDAFARRMQKRILRLEGQGPEAGRYKLLWRTDYVWAKCSLLQEIDFDAEGAREPAPIFTKKSATPSRSAIARPQILGSRDRSERVPAARCGHNLPRVWTRHISWGAIRSAKRTNK